MKKLVEEIDIMPTPEAYVKMLLLMAMDGTKEARETALREFNKAMRIAYAYYWGKTRPEYKMEGIEGKWQKSSNTL